MMHCRAAIECRHYDEPPKNLIRQPQDADSAVSVTADERCRAAAEDFR
jgi:hypothetical protein